MADNRVFESDVLVIGGGIAGCLAAIRAKEKGLNVNLVDMGYAGYTGTTRQALLGFAVYNPKWGPELNFLVETISCKGEYLNDCEWSEIILKDSWAIFQELASWGADFRLESEKYFLKRYPPFTIIPLGEYGVGPACRKRVEASGVKIIDRVMITDLMKKDERIAGAVGFSLYTGDFCIFKAKSTVMATGCTSLVTGDGDALAYKAGAEITTKEFPYTWPGAAGTAGGWKEVAARNVFMRFVDGEANPIDVSDKYELDLTMEFLIHAGKGPIYWDLGSATREDIARMEKRIENVYRRFKPDFDPRQGGRRVALGGEHRMAGGTQTGGLWLANKNCATSLSGLFAAGECAGHRGLGAYHPAPGFGLLASAVTGTRAGNGAAEYAFQTDEIEMNGEELLRMKEDAYAPIRRKSGFDPRWAAQTIYNVMSPYFIRYIKHGERLKAALTLIEFVEKHVVPKLMAKDWHELWLAHEVRNIVLHAEMILKCSLFRTESRSTHYREDYPRRVDPDWLAWVKLKKDGDKMKLWKEPVPMKWWPDLSIPYEERYPRRFPGEL